MAGTRPLSEGVPSLHDRAKIKRRDLRKGTHSCWECKRRKMRCTVDGNARGTICRGCQRRGTACIGQEIPEEIAFRISDAHENGAAIDDVVERSVVNHYRGDSTLPGSTNVTVNGPLTPASMVSRSSRAAGAVLPLEHDVPPIAVSDQSLERISQHLYGALPSLKDAEIISKVRTLHDVPAYELMTMPYTILSQGDLEIMPGQVDDVDPRWHPVMIARSMLILASSLLHLDPKIHPEIRDLSEKPQVISERLIRLANHYVTSKDEMLGSVEALECVLIESVYQANLGNLRRSWMLARRALSIAQLMGLDHPDRHAQLQVLDGRRQHDPQIIWNRIIFLDRFLCVMLSLPAACPDSCWTPDAGLSCDSPKGQRLERIHCMVASRILESSGGKSIAIDRQKLQELDSELQKAARSLPTRWWLVPRLDASQADPRTVFWNTGRIFAQVLHYNLVYRLHLPYMFRSSPTDHTYDYSRITCVNASREILTRFLALRTFNGIASSCRIIDFIALMASLTLLLSHLHSQTSITENFLAHQYHSDRAIIEQVQESMEEAHQLRCDPLSARSADLLGRLMAIDIYEEDGYLRPANNVSIHPEAGGVENGDEDSVNIQIPYFGLIKIARDSNCNLKFQRSELRTPSLTKPDAPGSISATNFARSGHQIEDLSGDTNNHAHLETLPSASTTLIGSAAPTALPTPQTSSYLGSDHDIQGEVYPGIAADLDDWAFQGVDLAFFDTIMQSIESNEGNLGGGLLLSPSG